MWSVERAREAANSLCGLRPTFSLYLSFSICKRGLYFFKLVLFLYLFLTVRGSSLLHEGFLQPQEAGATLTAVHGLPLAVAFLIVEHRL